MAFESGQPLAPPVSYYKEPILVLLPALVRADTARADEVHSSQVCVVKELFRTDSAVAG